MIPFHSRRRKPPRTLKPEILFCIRGWNVINCPMLGESEAAPRSNSFILYSSLIRNGSPDRGSHSLVLAKADQAGIGGNEPADFKVKVAKMRIKVDMQPLATRQPCICHRLFDEPARVTLSPPGR